MTSSNVLGLRQTLSYAMPTMAIYFLFGPLFILQGIYSKYFGMALTTIAMVLFFANLLDAVTDPVVGYLSDRYYRRTGKRKPFILTGGLLFLFSSYFLYIPPDNVTAVYFFGWYVTATLMLKLFDIPHLAWPAELTNYPQERNKLYSLRFFAVLSGSLLFYAMTQLSLFDSTEITPQTLTWCVLMGGVLLLPTLYSCIKWAPDGGRVDNYQHYNQSMRCSLRDIIFANKPFLLFLLAVLLVGSGVSIWTALIFIYTDSYLGLGAQFALIYIVSNVASMLALGVWYNAANRFGNIALSMLSVSMMALGIFCTGLLAPGADGLLPLSVAVIMVNVGSATFVSMAASLLSHIVDYGTWKFGVDYAATYFSIYTMVMKVNFAIGSAIGLGIAGWYGFEPSSISGQSTDAIWGLRLAIAWLPASIVMTSLIVIAILPINSQRHGIILKRLNARRVRTAKGISDEGRNLTTAGSLSEFSDSIENTATHVIKI